MADSVDVADKFMMMAERAFKQRDTLARALKEIAAIENQEFGPDWEEIEQARKIANDALSAVGVGGAAK
jgi:hypothetical protein